MIEFLKAGSLKDTKRALKVSKKGLGTHRRAKLKKRVPNEPAPRPAEQSQEMIWMASFNEQKLSTDIKSMNRTCWSSVK